MFTSKRLVSYEENLFDHNAQEPVTLTFSDGTKATCDLLVGADGVKSAVRGSMLEKIAQIAEAEGEVDKAGELRGLVTAKWSGAVVYRVLVPADQLRQISPEHTALKRPLQVNLLVLSLVH